MRATGQARNLTGPARPRGGAGRRRPGDPRRVAGRLGRRLAGFGRHLSRRQAHPRRAGRRRATPSGASAGAGCCPRTELLDGALQTRTSTLQARRFHEALAESLVLVHGGMAQNVGPILNMVTAKYLLAEPRRVAGPAGGARDLRARSSRPCEPRDVRALGAPDDPELGRAAQGDHPLGEQPVHRVDHPPRPRAALGDDFWGFLMLGGMSGGGMAFFVAPHRHAEFRDEIAAIMQRVKAALDDALPFAMEPVVYDFRINPHGTFADARDRRRRR